MSAQKSPAVMSHVWRWLPLTLVLVLFFYGMFVRNSVPSVAEDSAEVAKTATYLNSPDSLKTLITTLDRQVQAAEMAWSSAMNFMLLGLFILAGIAVVFWFQYYQAKQRLKELESNREA